MLPSHNMNVVWWFGIIPNKNYNLVINQFLQCGTSGTGLFIHQPWQSNEVAHTLGFVLKGHDHYRDTIQRHWSSLASMNCRKSQMCHECSREGWVPYQYLNIAQGFGPCMIPCLHQGQSLVLGNMRSLSWYGKCISYQNFVLLVKNYVLLSGRNV